MRIVSFTKWGFRPPCPTFRPGACESSHYQLTFEHDSESKVKERAKWSGPQKRQFWIKEGFPTAYHKLHQGSKANEVTRMLRKSLREASALRGPLPSQPWFCKIGCKMASQRLLNTDRRTLSCLYGHHQLHLLRYIYRNCRHAIHKGVKTERRICADSSNAPTPLSPLED